MEPALEMAREADIMIVIGTSLAVYPAAGLVDVIAPTCDLYVVDKQINTLRIPKRASTIESAASEAVPYLVAQLIERYATL